ncbi:MAG: flagellar basal body rod C-terminal domain-containing protein, partial [Planctomycetota bacterium]
FAAGPNSGLPVEASPGQPGTAEIIAGATELSNTDVGHELVGLFQASVAFRAGVAVIGTADTMLDELMSLPRWA